MPPCHSMPTSSACRAGARSTLTAPGLFTSTLANRKSSCSNRRLPTRRSDVLSPSAARAFIMSATGCPISMPRSRRAAKPGTPSSTTCHEPGPAAVESPFFTPGPPTARWSNSPNRPSAGHNVRLLLVVPGFALVARLIDPAGLGEVKVLDQPPLAGLYHVDGNRDLAPVVRQFRRDAPDSRLARRHVAERAGLNAMQEELHDHDAFFIILGMDLRRRPPVGSPEFGHAREVAVCHG